MSAAPRTPRRSTPRICFVAAIEMQVEAYLLEHLRALSAVYDISVAVNTNNPRFLEPSGFVWGNFAGPDGARLRCFHL